MNVIIRTGKKEDIPSILGLIRELAEYERAPEQVEVTVESMERDGFSSNPLYGFFVAEENGEILGMALYYFRYSTWKGKRLYLEDFYVKENHRGRKIGRMLFDKILEFAIETNCNGMMWQVLEWNTPAIGFYSSYGADFDGEWLNGSISRDQIIALTHNPK